ncbi:hypothetical protein [uncultured Pseudomonas sp.]|uniref:hypothetical protein n=1 Tax=uncultured Pseudomonas sp. TaxID=114707 RepID=UPI00258C5E77|nr:hypothetical protein [uncultured Pseudomonas sp.]
MNKLQIQARLIERGSNFRKFALAGGYEPRTVTQVVTRWAGQRELPRGRLSFRILKELSRVIDAEIVPGILSEEPATGTAISSIAG